MKLDVLGLYWAFLNMRRKPYKAHPKPLPLIFQLMKKPLTFIYLFIIILRSASQEP